MQDSNDSPATRQPTAISRALTSAKILLLLLYAMVSLPGAFLLVLPRSIFRVVCRELEGPVNPFVVCLKSLAILLPLALLIALIRRMAIKHAMVSVGLATMFAWIQVLGVIACINVAEIQLPVSLQIVVWSAAIGFGVINLLLFLSVARMLKR